MTQHLAGEETAASPAPPAADSLAALAEGLSPRARTVPDVDGGVAAVRDRAYAALQDGLSWPAARAAAWRHTPLGGLQQVAWRAADVGSLASLDEGAVEALLATLPETETRLVFVNGLLAPALSRTTAAGAPADNGPLLANLRDVATCAPAALPHLGALGLHQGEAFAALNTSQLGDGALVVVPAGKSLHGVQLVFLGAPQPHPTYAAPRTLVVVERGGSAQVTEHHLAGPRGANAAAAEARFSNPVTEIFLGDNARLAYGVLQGEAPGDVHLSALGARMGRDANLSLHTFDEGAKLCRRAVHVRLEGPGGDATLGHVALAGAGQHQATHAVVQHAAGHTQSRQVFKTAVQARGTAAFGGTVDIQPHAPKASANQLSRALLLDDGARAYLQPQLEILTDDVRCAHGATVGDLDKDALFYLMSRGLTEGVAKRLLTLAFLDDALRGAPKSLRPEFARRTGAWLGAPVEEGLEAAGEAMPEAVS